MIGGSLGGQCRRIFLLLVALLYLNGHGPNWCPRPDPNGLLRTLKWVGPVEMPLALERQDGDACECRNFYMSAVVDTFSALELWPITL
jgi:hypothetical protein